MSSSRKNPIVLSYTKYPKLFDFYKALHLWTVEEIDIAQT